DESDDVVVAEIAIGEWVRRHGSRRGGKLTRWSDERKRSPSNIRAAATAQMKRECAILLDRRARRSSDPDHAGWPCSDDVGVDIHGRRRARAERSRAWQAREAGAAGGRRAEPAGGESGAWCGAGGGAEGAGEGSLRARPGRI